MGPLITEDPMSSQTHRGELLTGISNALVRLHKEYYGKGPTKTKTFIVDDTVVCLLRGGFTPVERTLIASGREDAVRQIRHTFQEAMRTRFTAVVEEILGRRVIAYLSQVHTDPEVSIEVFLLEPSGEAAAAMSEGQEVVDEEGEEQGDA
jgi:uncharacterized protein YbcI